MATEIIKSFGNLQSELEQAKSFLKGVDENIKRLIGRDPSEIIPPQPGIKRGPPTDESDSKSRLFSQAVSRNRNFGPENNDPSSKRRTSVFKRLSDRPIEQEIWIHPPKQLISKVIVTPREVPSRQEVLASRRTDEKSKARNKRMFGALLGTLQKFQQEETKLKSKEQKRAQVEKKIDDLEIKEKAEIRKERQELFFNRRKKLVEIKIIEIKMMRMREFATWEQRVKPRSNFILTKTKPHIQYLPRRLNDTSKTLLASSKTDVEKMIEKRKQEVFAELQRIEDRITKNFEMRNPKDDADITENEKHVNDEVADQSSKDDYVNEVNAEIQEIINTVHTEAEENVENHVMEGLTHKSDEAGEDMDADVNEKTESDLILPGNCTNNEEANQEDANEDNIHIYDDLISKTEESE